MYNQTALDEALKYISPTATNAEWYLFLNRIITTKPPEVYYEFSLYYHSKNIDKLIELVSDYTEINPHGNLSEKQWERLLSLNIKVDGYNQPRSAFIFSNITQIKSTLPWSTLTNDVLYLNLKLSIFLIRTNEDEIYERIKLSNSLANRLTHKEKVKRETRLELLRQKQILEDFNKKDLNITILNKIDLFNFYKLLTSKPDIFAYLPKCAQKVISAINTLQNEKWYKYIIYNNAEAINKPIPINYSDSVEYEKDSQSYVKEMSVRTQVDSLFSTYSHINEILKLKFLHLFLMNANNKIEALKYLNDMHTLIFSKEQEIIPHEYKDTQLKHIYITYLYSLVQHIDKDSLYAYIRSFTITCSMDLDTRSSEYNHIYVSMLDSLSHEETNQLALDLYTKDISLSDKNNRWYSRNSYYDAPLWKVLLPYFNQLNYETRLHIISNYAKDKKIDSHDINRMCRNAFQLNEDLLDSDPSPSELLDIDHSILKQLLPEHIKLFKVGNILNYSFMDYIEQLNNNISLSHMQSISNYNPDINDIDFELCT